MPVDRELVHSIKYLSFLKINYNLKLSTNFNAI